jgi:hypothetical protein
VRRLIAVLGVLAAVAGCGDDPVVEEPPAPEPTAEQPEATPMPTDSAANAFIGSIAIDPADGTMFLGTGLGLFRYEGRGEAERVVGELKTSSGSGDVSSNLVVRFAGPGELLASGHPEGAGGLPENLGLIRSSDGGRAWEPVSDLGESDFHILQVEGDRIAAVHAEDVDVRVSADGGQSWEPRTPPDMPVDVAFDGDRMVVSTEQGLFASTDGGQSWRQGEPAQASQLAWGEELYRADAGGMVFASGDGGRTWEERGTVELTVNELVLDEEGALYASVPGGEVRRSRDGGETWRSYLTLGE